MTEEIPPNEYCEQLLVRTIIMFQVFREDGDKFFDRAYVDAKSHFYQLDPLNKALFVMICDLLQVEHTLIQDASRRRRFS